MHPWTTLYMCPQNLFSSGIFAHVYKPLYLNSWPKSRNGKKIHHPNIFKLSILQKNKWKVGQTLEVTLLAPSNIPPPRYVRIYHFLLGPPQNHKQYEVRINDYTTWSCMDFSSIMFTLLNKWGPWVPCKHLYYILQYAMYFRIEEPFIHFPS
jgi:hypothetical protein